MNEAAQREGNVVSERGLTSAVATVEKASWQGKQRRVARQH